MIRAHLKMLPPLLAVVALALFVIYRFTIGVDYNSNETTTPSLRLGRGSSYALLVLLCLLWLPVLKKLINLIYRAPLYHWLSSQKLQLLHRMMGYTVMALALGHGIGYLHYYQTLDAPLAETLLGEEPDLIRSMKTGMYEFVSDDESISRIHQWINDGARESEFETAVRPIMKEDCTKCHSQSSTQTYAIPRIPLVSYQEVAAWTDSGVASNQFRVNSTGISLLVLMLVMVLCALPWVRKHHFHLFQSSHRLSYVVAPLLLIHIPHQWMWLVTPVISLFLLRLIDRGQRNLSGHCQLIHPSLLKLDIQLAKPLKAHVGDHILLRVNALGREWHPFSITAINDRSLCLKIRPIGDWTTKLLAHSSSTLCVDIRGPYRGICVKSQKQEKLWLISGGIGITPFLNLLRHRHTKTEFLGIIWSVRNAIEAQLLLDEYDHYDSKFSQLKLHLYLSQGEWPKALTARWPNVCFHHGTADFRELESERSDSVYICGPKSFNRAAKKVAREQKIPVFVESFGG